MCPKIWIIYKYIILCRITFDKIYKYKITKVYLILIPRVYGDSYWNVYLTSCAGIISGLLEIWILCCFNSRCFAVKFEQKRLLNFRPNSYIDRMCEVSQMVKCDPSCHRWVGAGHLERRFPLQTFWVHRGKTKYLHFITETLFFVSKILSFHFVRVVCVFVPSPRHRSA